MTRLLLITFALTLALAAPASAKTTVCKVGYYSPGIESEFPAPGKLRAHNLPRLTYGYAPRCLVAESLVGAVQQAWADGDYNSRTVHIQGARWDGGTWRVRYRLATNGQWSWGEFTATRGKQRVTWDGYS